MAKPNKNNRLGRGLSALLKDEPTRAYILDRLERYKETCEFRLEKANLFIDNLNQNF